MQQLRQQLEVLPQVDTQIVVPASETAMPVERDRIPMPEQVGAAAVRDTVREHGSYHVVNTNRGAASELPEVSAIAADAEADPTGLPPVRSLYRNAEDLQAAYRIGPRIGGR
jgi:hypothetical protein